MTDPHGVTTGNVASYAAPWSVAEYTREEGLWPLEAALVREFFPPPPAHVLDLGCGAGRTTIGLARAGYRPIGIDLAEGLLNEGRHRHPALDYRVMDAADLRFPDATFDAALFSYHGIDCIYPVVERIRCMAEVFRVLRPGGVFLLSGHNLLGALGSGGWLYLHAYWNGLRLLARQVTNPLAHEWYIRYRDGGGVQHLYSAPPSRTVHQLESVGFSVLDVRGSTGERRPGAVRLHEQHVHFAAVKPA